MYCICTLYALLYTCIQDKGRPECTLPRPIRVQVPGNMNTVTFHTGRKMTYDPSLFPSLEGKDLESIFRPEMVYAEGSGFNLPNSASEIARSAYVLYLGRLETQRNIKTSLGMSRKWAGYYHTV